LHDDEPYITDSSAGGDVDISVQGIAEFYSAHLNSIISNYTDFQTGKVSTFLQDADVQSIEAQISQLKKNYRSIFLNSNPQYIQYNTASLIDAGQFLFIVLQGTESDEFDIIYRDSTNRIIKKEYNCTVTNGIYISIPFFFDTFGNIEDNIKFEIKRNTSTINYYIFR
jgi:hypothetical protein